MKNTQSRPLPAVRIGQGDRLLTLEAAPSEGGYAPCRIEAVASASGRRFTASHDRLMIEASEAVIQRLADFSSLLTEQWELPCTEGGWLRFRRQARGSITVTYRICGWKASAAMEGQLEVEGEFAGQLCEDLAKLLRNGG